MLVPIVVLNERLRAFPGDNQPGPNATGLFDLKHHRHVLQRFLDSNDDDFLSDRRRVFIKRFVRDANRY